MSPSNSALMNRLILLVLCLNLVCLVLLVVRSYQNAGPGSRAQTPPAVPDAVEAEPAVAEAPAQPVPLPRPSPAPVTRKSVPAPVREAAPAREPNPAPSEVPAEALAVPPAPAAPLVNLPSRSAVGVPGVSAGHNDRALPELRGRVLLRGMPPPEIPIHLGPACGFLHPDARQVTTRHYVVDSEGGLANVLVWLKNAAPAPPVMEPPVLDQQACLFQPYVMGVVAGQPFQVRNSDPVLHNLHATPKRNREFNLGQPTQGQVTTLSFSHPERAIRIKCDVHPWMFAYVHVLEHPYFAITDANGVFRLPSGFPPGRYIVGISHLKAGEIEREIRLRAGERGELNLELKVPDLAQARR